MPPCETVLENRGQMSQLPGEILRKIKVIVSHIHETASVSSAAIQTLDMQSKSTALSKE